MIQYKLSVENKEQHFLTISYTFPVNDKELVAVQLPAWRPGRYELGNFAKNIQKFDVFNEKKEQLAFTKTSKDRWIIETTQSKSVTINYNYYAIDFNAGSTFVGDDVLYVNPVNCFLYAEGLENDGCEIVYPISENQQIACGLPKQENKMMATSFDELADSPFIISSKLVSKSYKVNNIPFYVWFYGECKPNWDKLLPDFEKFTQFQVDKFGGFPVSEYHFINIIHPFKSYHGVEHINSTIITLGPSYDVFDSLYSELLGISSHELYHTWNIKNIRPKEMMPYDYSKENYSRLGYVAEGVTTYMGDLALYESGVFDKTAYAKEFTTYLNRHFSNDGRSNLSVADSSFDTWLDGYVMGIPDRKSSIYTEGALISFLIDMMIRNSTNGEKSLHNVMQLMYENFGLKGIGYTEEDYLNTIEAVAGNNNIDFIYGNFINHPGDIEELLFDQLKEFGFNAEKTPAVNLTNQIGLKGINQPDGSYKVVHSKVDSVAYLAGLTRDDVVTAINGYKLNGDLDKWLTYFKSENIVLTVVHNAHFRKVNLINIGNNKAFFDYLVQPI